MINKLCRTFTLGSIYVVLAFITLFDIHSYIISTYFIIVSGAYNYLNVSAIIGHNAEIPCELTPHTKTDNAYLVLWWFKDIFGTPIYR